MSSEVEICNVALSQVHGGSINSLSESSKEAQQCTLHYAKVRDQVLTETDWGMNTKLSALAQLTSVTVFNWPYVWAYPTDCLRVNHLIRDIEFIATPAPGQSAVALRIEDTKFQTPDDLPPVEYQVMFDDTTSAKIIVTREACMRAHYRKRITDPNLMPINVQEAISFLLASKIAVPIAGVKDGTKLRVDALGLYTAWITKAADQDANEGHKPEQESEYIRVRQVK